VTPPLEHDWYGGGVPDNVAVGEGSWVYSSFAFMHCRSRAAVAVSVGRATGIYNGTHFELGPAGRVTIGDYCSVVGAIIVSNRRVVIGDCALIAHEVVLADSAAAAPVLPGDDSASPAEDDDEPSIVIGPNVWVATRAVLLGGARIGEGSIVGAAAVVDSEVPPFSVVAGNPARVVRELPRG